MKPDDYVLATGERHSVREFVEKVFTHVNRRIEWRGSGIDEQGIDAGSGRVLIEVDSRYFRPTEVDFLVGDSSKARQRFGWRHKTSFDDLVKERRWLKPISALCATKRGAGTGVTESAQAALFDFADKRVYVVSSSFNTGRVDHLYQEFT